MHMHIKKIRHSKLPITLESSDPLTYDMLYTIQLNMMYDSEDSRHSNQSCWLTWVDEDGHWSNPTTTKWNYSKKLLDIVIKML